MSNMREKLKVLDGWRNACSEKELSVNLKEKTNVMIELKYGRYSKYYITFMLNDSLSEKGFHEEFLKVVESSISLLSISKEGYHILQHVNNVRISYSKYDTRTNNGTILGKTSIPSISDDIELTKEIYKTIAKYVSIRDDYAELIKYLDSPDGYLLLFLIYTKYISNNALSYGRYIDNPDKFNGFANDNIDDTLWISRNDFNKFLEFILEKKMYMKEWVPKLVSASKRPIVQITHKPGCKWFLKIDKNLLGMIFENEGYLNKYEPVFGNDNIKKCNYLVNKIIMYITSK